MGFRFQRRFRIIPGIRLNVSASGVSTSIGTRGAWLTIGPRGMRTTVGIPGTGISYTEQSHGARTAPTNAPPSGQFLEQPAVPVESVPPVAPAESESITINLSINLSTLILGLAAILGLIAASIALLR